MRTNEDPLRISSPHFACLHPALTELERLMAEQQEAVEEARRISEWVHRCADEVDPTKWTAKIEEARDNLDELARLRVIYDEKVLTFMSCYLVWDVARSRMMNGRKNISDAIVDVLIAHDEIEDRGKEAHLKPIMQARLLKAMELHRADIEWFDSHGKSRQLEELAYNILVSAFNRLTEYLPEVMRGTTYGTTLRTYPPYSSDLVVQGKKYEKHLNPDVDLRQVRHVPFVDCVNSTHPASAKLAELLELLHPQFLVVHRLGDMLKVQNGKVNEAQHAYRLVNFLHRDEPQAPSCGGNLDQQVAQQNERRIEYQCYRQAIHVELVKFGKLLKEVVETLKASVEETSALLEEVSADSRTTVDRWMTVKIMMSNCLAADACLRRYVRDYFSQFDAYNRDLSRQAGERALEAAFQEVRGQYSFSIDRRRREKASEAESTES